MAEQQHWITVNGHHILVGGDQANTNPRPSQHTPAKMSQSGIPHEAAGGGSQHTAAQMSKSGIDHVMVKGQSVPVMSKPHTDDLALLQAGNNMKFGKVPMKDVETNRKTGDAHHDAHLDNIRENLFKVGVTPAQFKKAVLSRPDVRDFKDAKLI